MPAGPPNLPAIAAVNMMGATVIAVSIQQAMASVASALKVASDTIGAAAGQAATSIVGKLNQAGATIEQAQAVAAGSIAGKLASAPAPQIPPGPAETGVKPGQYKYNLWQDIDAPAAVAIVTGSSAPPFAVEHPCFRAGWEDLNDAISSKNAIQIMPLPGWCKQPGGPAAGPVPPVLVPPCDSGLYDSWQRANADGTYDCVYLCQGFPGPPGYQNKGAVLGALDHPPGSVFTCFGPPPPPPPPTQEQWYAGCLGTGNSMSWSSSMPAPAGVVSQVGPFVDQQQALAALGTCIGPPPPPPTGGGPPGTQGACCDETGTIKLPKCIYFDLCDWTKFETALYNALCRWTKDPLCQCTFKDADRYQVEDCDGVFDQSVSDYMGQIGAPVTQTGSVDDLAARVQEMFRSL